VSAGTVRPELNWLIPVVLSQGMRLAEAEAAIVSLNGQVQGMLAALELSFRYAGMESKVNALTSLAADAYRAEGRPVPPALAAAPPLHAGSGPRDQRPARERAAALGWGQAR
jgi:hypothetical protein